MQDTNKIQMKDNTEVRNDYTDNKQVVNTALSYFLQYSKLEYQ